MSTVILAAFILLVLCVVAHTENDRIPEKKLIKMMVKHDLKAERKRGDILSQGRRGNYRW